MQPYRKEKLGSLVRQIVSDIITRKMNDPRVAPLTTVTRVELTGDLAMARIFLSVPADSKAERRTMKALWHASGFIQRMLAERLTLRQCPQVRFEVDEAAKIAQKTMELLAENRRHEDCLEPPMPDSVS